MNPDQLSKRPYVLVKDGESAYYPVKILTSGGVQMSGELMCQYYNWPKAKGGHFAKGGDGMIFRVPINRMVSILPNPSMTKSSRGREKYYWSILEHLLPDKYSNR